MTVRPLAGRGFARHGSANDAVFPNNERYKSGDAAKWMPDPAVFAGTILDSARPWPSLVPGHDASRPGFR